MIKCMNKNVQVGFGEVIGNPCRHDDEKRDGDRGKMLKGISRSAFFYLPAKVVFNLLF